MHSINGFYRTGSTGFYMTGSTGGAERVSLTPAVENRTVVNCPLLVRWVFESIPHGGPIEFYPVLNNWCNKGRGIKYPVCGMVHIKDTLLLVGKCSPWSNGSGFPLSLSEWFLTICQERDVAQWVVRSIPRRAISFYQLVIHDWRNKDGGMCYSVCRMVHIKTHMLLSKRVSHEVTEVGFFFRCPRGPLP